MVTIPAGLFQVLFLEVLDVKVFALTEVRFGVHEQVVGAECTEKIGTDVRVVPMLLL